jgi:hypothetical protein
VRGRLERLEDLVAGMPKARGGDQDVLPVAFFARALDAMAHVRRAPIDAERWRYTLEGLRGEAPATVAAYVAALASLRHPDEDGAREILAGSGDVGTLWDLVGAFGRFGEGTTDTPDGGEGGS